MMNDIFIFVKSEGVILKISEGDGSNLWEDDISNGYVDYLCYDIYPLEDDIVSSDGGIMLLTDYVSTKYQKIRDLILDVLEFVFDNREESYIVLKS